jgi:hypothetical protein
MFRTFFHGHTQSACCEFIASVVDYYSRRARGPLYSDIHISQVSDGSSYRKKVPVCWYSPITAAAIAIDCCSGPLDCYASTRTSPGPLSARGLHTAPSVPYRRDVFRGTPRSQPELLPHPRSSTNFTPKRAAIGGLRVFQATALEPRDPSYDRVPS